MAKEFEALALNGHNYAMWVMDIKIRLVPWDSASNPQDAKDPKGKGLNQLQPSPTHCKWNWLFARCSTRTEQHHDFPSARGPCSHGEHVG